MYTLRQINGDGIFDQYLGLAYNAVNRFEHPEKFRELYKKVFNSDHVADIDPESTEHTQNVIGFVVNEQDVEIPIFNYNNNYVVTESGKTLTFLNKSMTRFSKIKN